MPTELTYCSKHSLELLKFTETFIRYVNRKHLPVMCCSKMTLLLYQSINFARVGILSCFVFFFHFSFFTSHTYLCITVHSSAASGPRYLASRLFTSVSLLIAGPLPHSLVSLTLHLGGELRLGIQIMVALLSSQIFQHFFISSY